MARDLPWKKPAATQHPTPKPNPSLRRLTPSTAAHRRALRSPSTSPPPEPPPQEFMIPPDDKYRMVEDELLQVAKQFTTHLHRAEYNRLKKLAEAQNADAIRRIQRPVVPGPATAEVKRRMEAAGRTERQRRVVSEDAELPWVGTSLQGLMDTPRGGDGRSIITPAVVGDAWTRVAERHTSGRRAVRLCSSPAEPQSSSGSGAGHGLVTPKRRLLDESPGGKRHVTSSSGGQSVSSLSSRSWAGKGSNWTVAESPCTRKLQDCAEPGRAEEEDEGAEEAVDDPFGVNKRRVQRVQSREAIQRRDGEKSAEKLPADTIPSFL